MNNPGQTILLVSLFLMNAAGFLVMFSDKKKPGMAIGESRTDAAAHSHPRRQPGLPLRNVLFPAQTKHRKFTIGIP